MRIEQASIASSYSGSFPKESAKKSEFLGFVRNISDAFPQKENPSYRRGALQGEGVVSTFDCDQNENFLYSINAQTCVICTLYDAERKSGAVLHLDHNLQGLIDDAIDSAIDAMDPANTGKVSATLSGGVWFLGGEDIGRPLKQSLARFSVTPTWDQWSFTPCSQHNYGAVLDLSSGKVDVFEHSVRSAQEFHTPLLKEASRSSNPNAEHERALSFMRRFNEPAIKEQKGNAVFCNPTSLDQVAKPDQIDKFAIKIHKV